VVPRYASRLFLLAALLWVGFAPSAFAVRAPSVSALVPSENRVGGSGQFASGRLSIEDQQSPINTPGLEGCGYETASGRLKWLNRDPIEEAGFLTLQTRGRLFRLGRPKHDYYFVENNPVNLVDPLGLDIFPNGKVEFDSNCTQPIYYINDDAPKGNEWTWQISPGSGVVVSTDGIGWSDPKGAPKGRKIPNGNKCKVSCDAKGFVQAVKCDDPFYCPSSKPWTPGGGPPDNLPPLPKPTPNQYE